MRDSIERALIPLWSPCRVVKDASDWSYRPTCTSPMSQPGRMEAGAPFNGVLEVGFAYVGSGLLGNQPYLTSVS